MNKPLKSLLLALAGCLVAVPHIEAQVQQSINISLTINNQVGSTIQPIHFSNKDIIAKMVGTNVPGAKLLLVMPFKPVPDAAANIGASLRVIDAHGNTLAQTTSDSFNIYQDPASQAGTRTIAIEGWSFDIDNFGAELTGQATWTKSASGAGGLGSFHCNVSGPCVIIGVTDGYKPCVGTITGGWPQPARN